MYQFTHKAYKDKQFCGLKYYSIEYEIKRKFEFITNTTQLVSIKIYLWTSKRVKNEIIPRKNSLLMPILA